MPYLDIKRRVSQRLFGKSANWSDEESAALQSLINGAALELYNSADLEDCLREQSFETANERYLALPYYVGNVRAIRTHCGVVTLHDRRPQYHNKRWNCDDPMTFRILGYSPLIRALSNATPLEVGTTSEPVVVKFTGSTAAANNVESTVTVNADGTVSGVSANYTDVYSITKDRVTQVDIVILDENEETVSVIPNDQVEARYQILEIGEQAGQTCSTKPVRDVCIDVLYKLTYRPMINDADDFPSPGYEDAIFYKVLERQALETGDVNQLQTVGAFYQKSKLLAADKMKDHGVGRTHELRLGRARFNMGRRSVIGRNVYDRYDQ